MSGHGSTEEAEIQERLRALRAELPDAGFSASLHLKLAAAGEPDPASPWDRLLTFWKDRAPVLWPAVGAATGLLVFLLMGALFPRPEAAAPQVAVAPAPAALEPAEQPGSVVPASKVAVIKLSFSADVAVEEAQFQVSLPEGLAFWADGEELPVRSFKWSQALTAGANVIPIAVRGHTPGRYLVSAVAFLGGQEVQHDVVLEVTAG